MRGKEMLLFHKVPGTNWVGDYILPLNVLKEVSPSAHHHARSKYQGREGRPEEPVPPLGCTWGDTINLSAIHPAVMGKTLWECWVSNAPYFAFEISIFKLDLTKLAVFEFHQDDIFRPGTYRMFESSDREQQAVICEATQAYYRECAACGERPFRFQGVPHFLYLGKIDIRGLRMVSG